MKKIELFSLLAMVILTFGACNAETKPSSETLSSEPSLSIESEANSQMSSETSSLSPEQQKLQDSFDEMTNNGSEVVIKEVEPLVYEIHYKIPIDKEQDSSHSYNMIETAVTEAYGEHDPITVRIYDENGKLVATNENSENYWEMQEVE